MNVQTSRGRAMRRFRRFFTVLCVGSSGLLLASGALCTWSYTARSILYADRRIRNKAVKHIVDMSQIQSVWLAREGPSLSTSLWLQITFDDGTTQSAPTAPGPPAGTYPFVAAAKGKLLVGSSIITLRTAPNGWKQTYDTRSIVVNLETLAALAGIVLSFAAVLRAIAGRGYPAGRCQRCGYSLIGLLSARCPECGQPTDTAMQGTISTLPAARPAGTSVAANELVVAADRPEHEVCSLDDSSSL